MNFRPKLALLLGGVSLLTALLVSFIFLTQGRELVLAGFEARALAAAEHLAHEIDAQVRRKGARADLETVLQGFTYDRDIVFTAVYDSRGRRLASFDPSGLDPWDGSTLQPPVQAASRGWRGSPQGRVFEVRLPVDGAGWVVVGAWPGTVDGLHRRMVSTAVVRIAALMALGAAAGWLLAGRFVRPILRIVEANRAFVLGDWERSRIPEEEYPKDEVGRIMRTRAEVMETLVRTEAMYRALAETQREKADKLEAANKELQALREQLTHSEKLSVMGQVVAGVAHELNNPLTGIMGFSQLLLMEKYVQEDPPTRADLERIFNEAQRCQKIVRNLSTFSRQHKPEKIGLGLNDLLQDCLKLESYQLQTRNIKVVRELEVELPRTMGDFHQLQQVFLNLIINAQQAMTDHRGGGTLWVRTRTAGELIRVELEDDGPGVPAELVGRIFEPFFTTKEPGKGTGLGLSISYGIVKEHGGDIRAESRPGRGALFVVELPIVPETNGEPSQAARLSELPRGRRVLVVDDEQIVLDLAARILREAGLEPELARDGLAAQEKLQRGDYDAVLCDLRMPRLDGVGLFEWARKAAPAAAARWAFLTGSVTGEAEASLRATGRPILQKPFAPSALRETLAALLKPA